MKLQWDIVGEHFYETGVSQGVLYPYDAAAKAYTKGYAWNGLTNVTETPSGADANAQYADDLKYLNLRSAETFGGTIQAFTYPPEFAECNGAAEVAKGVTIGQQSRRMFGLSYKTILGNDVDGNDYSYKLHLVYGATVNPSESAYNTVNESPEPISMSWEFTTTPVAVKGFKPTALLTIDASKLTTADEKKALAALEEKLYGADAKSGQTGTGSDATLPSPEEVIALFPALSK